MLVSLGQQKPPADNTPETGSHQLRLGKLVRFADENLGQRLRARQENPLQIAHHIVPDQPVVLDRPDPSMHRPIRRLQPEHQPVATEPASGLAMSERQKTKDKAATIPLESEDASAASRRQDTATAGTRLSTASRPTKTRPLSWAAQRMPRQQPRRQASRAVPWLDATKPVCPVESICDDEVDSTYVTRQ